MSSIKLATLNMSLWRGWPHRDRVETKSRETHFEDHCPLRTCWDTRRVLLGLWPCLNIWRSWEWGEWESRTELGAVQYEKSREVIFGPSARIPGPKHSLPPRAGEWERALGPFMVYNNHRSCASRDQRSNQISSCRDLNLITCRGQGKEFFFPEEPQDWLNTQQGALARPWRITLLAAAQKQGDTASGWMRWVGPFCCSLQSVCQAEWRNSEKAQVLGIHPGAPV